MDIAAILEDARREARCEVTLAMAAQAREKIIEGLK